jgi:hypothetical protein
MIIDGFKNFDMLCAFYTVIKSLNYLVYSTNTASMVKQQRYATKFVYNELLKSDHFRRFAAKMAA